MYYGNGELYTDDNFIKNIEGAKAAGLRVGAYFFSQAITADEAKAEAKFVLDLLDGRELDLPVFFDWERISGDDARTDGLDNETLTDCAVAFCETIKAAGYEPGVYIYNDTGYYGYDLALQRGHRDQPDAPVDAARRQLMLRTADVVARPVVAGHAVPPRHKTGGFYMIFFF